MSNIYIASTLTNAARVQDLRDKLTSLGIGLSYDWTLHGRVADPDILIKIAENQFRGIIAASCILIVMPGKYGTFFEFGMAYALKKPIVVLLDQYDGPPEPNLSLNDVMYCKTEAEALQAVQTLKVHQPVRRHLIDILIEEESE